MMKTTHNTLKEMTNVQKPFYFVSTLLLLLLLTLSMADATMVGVNRAEIEFDDVLRGGYAEEQFVVSIGSEDDVEIFFEPRGEIADWVRLEPDEQGIPVNENSPLEMNVIVEPPREARVDTYEGEILVLTGALDGERGRMGTEVVAAFNVKLTVDITDTQILECAAGGLDVASAEVGHPSEFTATIRNRGNVMVSPVFEFDIYDKDEQDVVLSDTYALEEDISPTSDTTVVADLDWDLDPSQYWVRISDDTCGVSSYQSFTVLEKGAIQDEGEFTRIEHDAWGTPGEIIPIRPQFKNTGERIVTAEFKGKVLHNGDVIDVLESSSLDVEPGESAEFEVFHTPQDEGQYKISGRIHYNNKVSYEKSSILNINNESVDSSDSRIDPLTIVFFTLLFFLLAIVFLLFRRKRR